MSVSSKVSRYKTVSKWHQRPTLCCRASKLWPFLLLLDHSDRQILQPVSDRLCFVKGLHFRPQCSAPDFPRPTGEKAEHFPPNRPLEIGSDPLIAAVQPIYPATCGFKPRRHKDGANQSASSHDVRHHIPMRAWSGSPSGGQGALADLISSTVWD